LLFINKEDFLGIDRRAIAKMPDKELALWQSDFPVESPQFILASYEWQRRLIVDQVKAVRWAAWLSVFGVITGIILGALLPYFERKIENLHGVVIINSPIHKSAEENAKNDEQRPVAAPENNSALMGTKHVEPKSVVGALKSGKP
jgi:hypothetical protein